MEPEPVGVVGLGLLGRGIAACFAGRGFEVVGYEPTQELLAAARPHIDRIIGEVCEYANTSAGRFVPTTDLRALAGCALVVESVVEDASVKQAVLGEIERVVAAEAILATNTSAIPITQLQRPLRHPARFIGMHFAGPAHVTRFLEVIRGELTSDETCARVEQLAWRVGKEPCVCRKDVPGFIANRIAYAMYREAFHLLESGVADAGSIDRAVRNALSLWAAICGPFRWIDISGGPELYARAMQRVLPTLSSATELPPTLQGLSAGGRGVFDYAPEEHARWAELWHENALRATRLLDELFPLARPGGGEPGHE